MLLRFKKMCADLEISNEFTKHNKNIIDALYKLSNSDSMNCTVSVLLNSFAKYNAGFPRMSSCVLRSNEQKWSEKSEHKPV